MDDCLIGSESEHDLLNMQQNFKKNLSNGGFILRKWQTNDSNLYKLMNPLIEVF